MRDKHRLLEAANWYHQAKYDLKAAQWNLEGGFYSTVCFLSQQSAEKVLKALIYFGGISRQKLLTHSVFNLLKRTTNLLPELENYLEDARELDLHYIPSRYPNGLVSGFPHQFYGKQTAEKTLNSANKIFKAIENYFHAKGFFPDEEMEE